MQPPDIEIYLAGVTAAAVRDWLTGRFPDAAPTWKPAGKHQWRSELSHDGQRIPLLVIENACPGYTSLWFDSAHTPWSSDQDCAREAFAHFGVAIRATLGSWQEGDDPDLWWEISAAGEHELHWPG